MGRQAGEWGRGRGVRTQERSCRGMAHSICFSFSLYFFFSSGEGLGVGVGGQRELRGDRGGRATGRREGGSARGGGRGACAGVWVVRERRRRRRIVRG